MPEERGKGEGRGRRRIDVMDGRARKVAGRIHQLRRRAVSITGQMAERM